MDFSQYGGASDELTALLATLPAPPDLSLEELKVANNKSREEASAAEMQILAPKILMQDHSIVARDGYKIEARSYRPSSIPPTQPLPITIYYHGGGFLFGTLSSEDSTCTLMALATNTVVVNVNYRHTPEWKYPTAWHDSEDSYEWVFANATSPSLSGDPSQIVISGISAGAQLAAALALTKKRENAPSYAGLKGQVLMIPCTAHPACYDPILQQMVNAEVSSYKENEFAPILPVERVLLFTGLLFTGPPDPSDRKANPGLASPQEVEGLPPTTFGIAGLDPLRDEGLLYAKLLAENGVATDVHLFKGMPHGHRRFGSKLAASTHWDTVMHGGITWALGNPKASGKMDVNVL